MLIRTLASSCRSSLSKLLTRWLCDKETRAEDYRCWIDQSITFFTALKFLGKQAELVLFDKGEHTFRSTAKPTMRMKRLEHMIRWFKSHLSAK